MKRIESPGEGGRAIVESKPSDSTDQYPPGTGNTIWSEALAAQLTAPDVTKGEGHFGAGWQFAIFNDGPGSETARMRITLGYQVKGESETLATAWGGLGGVNATATSKAEVSVRGGYMKNHNIAPLVDPTYQSVNWAGRGARSSTGQFHDYVSHPEGVHISSIQWVEDIQIGAGYAFFAELLTKVEAEVDSIHGGHALAGANARESFSSKASYGIRAFSMDMTLLDGSAFCF
jgi:hypothetical protein